MMTDDFETTTEFDDYDLNQLPKALNQILNDVIFDGDTIEIVNGSDSMCFIYEPLENWIVIIEWFGTKDKDSYSIVNITGQAYDVLKEKF